MDKPTTDQFACAEDYYEALNAWYATEVDTAEWGDLVAA